MAKKTAPKKAEKSQPAKAAAPVRGAASGNGKSCGKSAGKAPVAAKIAKSQAHAPGANGGAKSSAAAAHAAQLAETLPAQKKSCKKADISVAPHAGAPVKSKTPNLEKTAVIDQTDLILEMKRKLHREIFDKCLEKKIFQDQDGEFWEE